MWAQPAGCCGADSMLHKGAGNWGLGPWRPKCSPAHLPCLVSCKESCLEGLSFSHLDRVAICINGVPNRKGLEKNALSPYFVISSTIGHNRGTAFALAWI